MHIINDFDVREFQSINSACTDFLESVPGANGRWNPTVRS